MPAVRAVTGPVPIHTEHPVTTARTSATSATRRKVSRGTSASTPYPRPRSIA